MAETIVAIALEVVKCVAKCLAPSAEHRISILRNYKTNFDNLKTEVKKLKDKTTDIQFDAEEKIGDRIKEDAQNWLKKANVIEQNFQNWLERASTIIGDDEAAGKIRKDKETVAAAVAEGKAAGDIREDAKTAAAKRRCFKGLCPDWKMRYQLSKEAIRQLEVVVKHLVEAEQLGSRIKRWREFKSNFQNLKEEVEKLKVESRSIQLRVDTAEKNGDEIKEDVQTWLKKAENIQENFQKWMERASKFIGDDQTAGEIKKDEETEAAVASAGEIRQNEDQATAAGELGEGEATAAAGAAGELGEGEATAAAGAAGEIGVDVQTAAEAKEISEDAETEAYQFSKEALMKLEAVLKHLEAGHFDKISDPVIPNDLRLLNPDYKAFESRASTLKNVISSLSDQNVSIVGIHGMGGIGKTTLAKEVAKQAKERKLFDSVIFVEVTEKPDIMKIQQQIAEKLKGLTLSKEETEPTRAGKLFERLKNEKKILIILDNIWAELNLHAIGIPLGDGRKLLLTARRVDVLSEKMNSQQNFSVNPLNDEEAWQLFEQMTGHIEDSEIKSIGRELASKCARLPIVIVTIARALRNKELFEWEDALQQMINHSSEDMADIYNNMELSYNYLSPILKKTIMLIRYANLTSIDELLMFGMVLDLFERINKLEGRRARVRTLVKKLKDSCLLLDSNIDDQDFSMHDVVRDAIIRIASREGHVFTNELMDKLAWPDENTLKVCPSIVLKNIETGELPQVFECQQLKLLSIDPGRFGSYYFHIPDEFFTRITELKVLVLANIDLSSLPSSLSFLTNLQALGLCNCKLDDIAIVGYLMKLEILSLKDSEIKQLPAEIGRLTQLKSLDLRTRFSLHNIPPDVISRLYQLEELYTGEFDKWGEQGLNKDRKNVSLDELKYMSNLTILEIQIQNAETLPRDLFFKKLERYKIQIGDSHSFYRDFISKSCRKFSLSLINTNICLNGGHIMQLKEIEDLCLVGSQDMKNVVYGLDRDGFQQLKYLQVSDNKNLLFIVDAGTYAIANAFPVLEYLVIKNLINLEKICYDQLTTESSFSQLMKIEVKRCRKLQNIFSFSIARRLQLLQSIDVKDCKNVKEIFAIERNDGEVTGNIKLSQLHSLTLSNLPQLGSLEYNSNDSDTLFSGKVALPNLEVLKLNKINVEKIMAIDDNDELKEEERKNKVATKKLNLEDKNNQKIFSFEKVKEVRIYNCAKLKHVFPASVVSSLSQLESIDIRKCGVEEIIFVVEEGVGTNPRFVFPRVISLTLEDLPNLTTFIFGRYTVEWPALKKLKMSNLSLQLESSKERQAQILVEKIFSNLEELYLGGKSIPMIWHFPEHHFCKIRYLAVEFDGSTVISSLDFLQRLQAIKVLKIGGDWVIKLKNEVVEDKTVALSYLNKCSDLKHIFKEKSNMDHLLHLQVQDCHNLVNLFPSLTSFQNLITLEVRQCKGLTNIVTYSTAKSLGQLRKMSISYCSMITEIVTADEGDEAKDYEIVFNELKELYLENLESLTSFCSANYTLKFPSMVELIVRAWPNLKSFSGGQLSTPKLHRVTQYSWIDEGCWKGDLNTTIQQLYEENIQKSELIMIELTNEAEAEVIVDKEVVASGSNVNIHGSEED